MSDSFGELPKHHKTIMKGCWRRRGLIMDNFDEIYQRYITSTHCEKCGKEYKNRKDRCMDHCHTTGQFRNFLCKPCNCRRDVTKRIDNSSGYQNITSRYQKCDNREYWEIILTINTKRYQKRFSKNNYSIEDVVAYRDDWKKELGIEE